MPPKTSPRARRRRRRSSCLYFLWILVIAWAVSRLVRVLTLPEFFVRTPPREDVEQPPNYYQILGVDPLVDDATLKRLRQRYTIELHPDKTGDNPEASKTFLIIQKALDTLQDGMTRCEYDKEHRIKGKWPVQTCRSVFRDEYRQNEREMYERHKEILEEKKKAARTSETKKGDGSESLGGKSESKSSWVKSSGWPPKPEPQARSSSVPRTTVKVEDGHKDSVEVVTSAVAVTFEGAAEWVALVCAKVAHYSWLVFSFVDRPLRGINKLFVRG